MFFSPSALAGAGLLALTSASLSAAAGLPSKADKVALERRQSDDPCTNISGRGRFVTPSAARSCLTSFPFNATIRTNLLDHATAVTQFYTFENHALNPGKAEFSDGTVDLQAELSRMRTATYANDFTFQLDLANTFNRLQDGHTTFTSTCYSGFASLLPFPIVAIAPSATSDLSAVEIRVAPNANSLFTSFGSSFSSFYPYELSQYDGALVVQIDGMSPTAYVDGVARNETGTYLDHGVRTSSVFSSYTLLEDGTMDQLFGDFALKRFPIQDSITMVLRRNGSTTDETLVVPFATAFTGFSFTSRATFYARNCAVSSTTNGDLIPALSASADAADARQHMREKIKASISKEIITPSRLLSSMESPTRGFKSKSAASPDLTRETSRLSLAATRTNATNGSSGILFYTLDADPQVGVMQIGTFGPESFLRAESVMVNGLMALSRTTTSLIIDVTNNGGGFLCLGILLFRLLTGTTFDAVPGFQSAFRANPLAQQIVDANIRLGLTQTFYSPISYSALSGASLGRRTDVFDNSTAYDLNGRTQIDSGRFADFCGSTAGYPRTPPFALNKIAIVSNGACGSTCAIFSTLMAERVNTAIIFAGGSPTTTTLNYKGLAGNQVLEWVDLDSEQITAQIPSANRVPRPLMDTNLRVNWRTAFSYEQLQTPIAYKSDPPDHRIAYTAQSVNRPDLVWQEVARILSASPQTTANPNLQQTATFTPSGTPTGAGAASGPSTTRTSAAALTSAVTSLWSIVVSVAFGSLALLA